MEREAFNNIPTGPLSDADLKRLADYAATRRRAFVTMWTPDRVLVQRFADIAEELIRRRAQEAAIRSILSAAADGGARLMAEDIRRVLDKRGQRR